MTIQQLISKSLFIINEALEKAEKPVITWSAGKDSQVMLHLIRQIRKDVPVLHFIGFDHPQKHFFSDLIRESLELEIVPTLPASTDVVAKGDHVEIIEEYRLNEKVALYFPIEAEPDYIPGPNSHCAIEKLNQPIEGKPLDVDCVFIGHRGDDIDYVHGAIPLESHAIEADGVLFVYPLKDWTEANIWAASELLNIPQNVARYARKDMDANADYFPMCVECLKPTAPDYVVCPKTGDLVYGIGKYLNLEQRREAWRAKFVNLQP